MTRVSGADESYWMASTQPTAYPCLDHASDTEIEVNGSIIKAGNTQSPIAVIGRATPVTGLPD
jgi:hypothetical protein